ncbi:MAG TPA: cobalamin-binding protein [Steroidobacteraceae bacterium]|nr:cobalamin-binding protein [Steroidobacteraceae bacterium]
MKRALCGSGFSLTLLLALIAGSAHAEPAKRIVSLAPHLTELAFTAGAGDRIVATVEYSDHPDAARAIPRIGDAFRVDLERLIATRPDAVLVWETGNPAQIVERIRTLGLPMVAFQTQRLADVATVLRAIGRLAGTSDVAERAASDYERQISALRELYRKRAPLRVFIQVDDRPLYTVNGKQIISEIVELCGGRNVFADLNELAPAIGIEAVIAANPQVIVSTDDTVPDAAAAWSRWRHIEAVRTGNVYTLVADDIARATTRLTVAADAVCRTLDTARQRLAQAPPH